MKCPRTRAADWGLSYSVKFDSGPAFRQTSEEELEKMGVQVIHSSAYNPQSMGLEERAVRTLTEVLKRNTNLS